MNQSARFRILGVAAGLAASAIQQQGTAGAQINPGAIAAYHGAAAVPQGAVPGVVAGAVIDGLPDAIWADQDNDGYVDGYVQNGQYHTGTPARYDATLRRVVPIIPHGAYVGPVFGSVVGSVIAQQRRGPPPPPPPLPSPPSPTPTPTPTPTPSPPPPPQAAEIVAGTCEGLPRFTLSPPLPSTQPATLNNSLFLKAGATLESVAEQLTSELEGRGYSSGFFCVPGGFALATNVERILGDKRSYPGDARWVTDPQGLLDLREGFSLGRVFDALIHADPGRYRMMIFYVTDKPVTPTNQPPTAAILTLPDTAPDELPVYYSDLPYTAAHRVRVLIYEFARPAVGAAPGIVRPTLSTRLQLRRARLLGLQP